MTIGIIGTTQGGTSAVAAVVRALGITLNGLDRCLDDSELFGPVDFPSYVVRTRNQLFPVWAWKYPIPYVPAEYPIFEHTDKLIVVWRDPIARSVHNRDLNAPNPTVFDEWFDITDTYRHIRHPHLHVSYEKLLQHPQESVQMIADFLEVPYISSATQAINPKLGYNANKG